MYYLCLSPRKGDFDEVLNDDIQLCEEFDRNGMLNSCLPLSSSLFKPFVKYSPW